ncbi:TetR/AcrR family transcriptional regulator [Curtobacterium sp. RRHDQ10]|uniref:TetR/AcrR family transcriptional regulator n=1 Tax=Curtobacterium phyllosphaerae TaxID=3413379 RepID=UPI003BF23A3C
MVDLQGGRPVRKDAARNRSALLDAAGRAFAALGFDAPLEPIAAAAGLGNATLHRHFPTRAALWEAVLRDPLLEVLDVVTACEVEPDPWTGLAEYVHRTAAIEARREGYHSLMTTRFEGADELLRIRAAIQGHVDRIITRARDAGAVRPDLATTDIAMVQLSIARTIEVFRDVAPEVHRRWVDLVLDGLRTPTPGPLSAPPLLPNQVWRAVMQRT